ncbi:MAG: cytochrome c family protein [Pseudomonadota bacterium]
MLDTMIATKVTAALCGSLLVFLLGSWAAEEIYHMGGHGHGGDHHQAYSIEVPEADGHGGEDEGVDIAAILATGDAGQGERVFNKCRACHQLEAGVNGTGPHLFGIVGRSVGTVDGFGYSGALSAAADTWTAENLYAFLENPKGYAPGTSMSFNGLAKPADKANLIAYLQGIGG